MDRYVRWIFRWSLLGAVGAACLLVAGCVSNKVDWGSRIGVYSYDQAVIDLGPPDKKAELSDGGLVADWMLRRATPGTAFAYYGPGPYYYRRPYGYWPMPYGYYEPGTPERWLRLTFDADRRLVAWKHLSR